MQHTAHNECHMSLIETSDVFAVEKPYRRGYEIGTFYFGCDSSKPSGRRQK